MTKPGFYQPIDADLSRVEELLVQSTRTDDDKVTALLGHVVASGGKRLRPVLTLLCGRLVEGARGRPSTGEDLVQAAAGIEAFHTASLVHDDLVEGAPVRRGRPTVNQLWGPPAAVLVGDCYLALAIDLMARVGNPEVYRTFSRAIREVAQGVIEELIPRRSSLATLEAARTRYFRIIELTTAALMAALNDDRAAIRKAAVGRSRDSLQALPHRHPEYYPYIIAMEAVEAAYKMLAAKNISKKKMIEAVMQTAEEIGKTFDMNTLRQWLAFSQPAQDMAWRGYKPEEILSAAINTSEDTYVRAIGYMVSEIAEIKPSSILTIRENYSPFADESFNEKLHEKTINRIFEDVIAKGMKLNSARQIYSAQESKTLDLIFTGKSFF